MIRGMTAPSFMDLALKTAENAGKAGEVPIGCVIVRGYEVIATAGNRTLTDRDPTAHAEILAIRQAAEAIGTERHLDGIGENVDAAQHAVAGINAEFNFFS